MQSLLTGRVRAGAAQLSRTILLLRLLGLWLNVRAKQRSRRQLG